MARKPLTKAQKAKKRFFYWKYRKAHPERYQKPKGLTYYKPMSKDEARAAEKAGISNDEYRYEQACSWAILMGEPLPDKRRFMDELSKRRAKK